MRQAEELCAFAGCHVTPRSRPYERVGLPRAASRRELAKIRVPSLGRLQGDNYYRPVTFSAPSLGDVPSQITGA